MMEILKEEKLISPNKLPFLQSQILQIIYIDISPDVTCTDGSSVNVSYEIGDQLNCATLQEEFDICYPEDCGSVKLADFEDKVILIIYEFDW